MTPVEQLADLRKRVAKLERALNGTPGKPGVLIDAVGQALGTVRKGLEDRIDQLERSRLRFAGIHEVGRVYEPGALVVKGGSLWHCHTVSSGVPGRCPDFQLCVKQGEIPKDLAA